MHGFGTALHDTTHACGSHADTLGALARQYHACSIHASMRWCPVVAAVVSPISQLLVRNVTGKCTLCMRVSRSVL